MNESENWWMSWRRRLNSPSGRRSLISIFLAIAIVFSALPILRCSREQNTLDYRAWFDAGQRVLAGQEIYQPSPREYDFIYPPTCALLLAAPSRLGQCTFIFVLIIINTLAWFLSLRFSAQLAAGPEKPRDALLYFVPSFLTLVSVWSNYHLGQPSIILLALMLGAFVSLRQDRQVVGGGLIALAAAMKAFPLVAVVYLAYRRYWKAVASLVATLVFLLLILPAPFRGGFQRAWSDLEKWSNGMLRYSEHGVGERTGRSQTWKNQSILGVANRLLRPVDIDDTTPPDQPAYVNIADLKFSTVNGIIVAVAIALGVTFVVAMPRWNARNGDTGALELALLLLLMLMLTPLTYSYSFVWLLLPFAVITERIIKARMPIIWWTVAAYAVFFLALPSRRIAQAYGSFFFGALLLFIGLSIELWREKRRLASS